jgi:hypothetical protein
MEPTHSSLPRQLSQLLSGRGWVAFEKRTSVTARKHDWPAQLRLVVDPGNATERSMPLGGERFRDIFNMEREQILRGLGPFRVRQMHDDGWTDGVSDRIFLHGIEGGISRASGLVLFDRCPPEGGAALLSALPVESTRLLETGSQIAQLLQRTYNRTVLRNDAPAQSPTVLGEPSYPWRR